MALVHKYQHLKPFALAKHFDIDHRMFNIKRMQKVIINTGNYNFLSPGEHYSTSRRCIVMNYGRACDIFNYKEMEAEKKEKEIKEIEAKKKRLKIKRKGGKKKGNDIKKKK